MQNGPMQRKSVGSPHKVSSADHALKVSFVVRRLEDWWGPPRLLPELQCCRPEESWVPVLRLPEPEQLRLAACSS